MIGDFKIPDSFLDELLASWGRGPRVWRSPFPEPYASAPIALRCLQLLRQRLERATPGAQARLYLDGAQRGLLYDPHLPSTKEDTLEEYEQRLLHMFGEQQMGLVVPDVQSLDEALWWRALAIARPLYERLGVPAGGAHSEIFFGNYQRSFFRLHKDHLDTLTFVASGRKRILVWPYEVFAEHPGAPPNGELKQVHFEAPVDYEPYREQAIVLEGGAGDIFFWPASYWHVAEAIDDGFVTTVTLAFFATATRASGSPFMLADDAAGRFALDGLDTSDPPYPAVHVAPQTTLETALTGLERCLTRHLKDPALQRARREFGLAWLSGYGFRYRLAEKAPEELSLDDWLEIDPRNPLLWTDIEEGGFPCAVNGIILTATPKFLPLLRHLNQGGRFLVSELLSRFANEDLTSEEIVEALAQLGSARYFLRHPG